MGLLATRFLVPWYLFFCGGLIAIIGAAADALATGARRFASVAALLIFLLPVAIRQERLSTLETQVSDLEIRTMRAGLAGWLDTKGWDNQRYLLVVRPFVFRPAFAERVLGDGASAGENARLSTAQSPAVVPWMIIALLRERNDHPVGRSVGLDWCVTDQDCVQRVLRDGHSVAVALVDSVHRIESSTVPYVINLSLLTDRPVAPVIERKEAQAPPPKAAARTATVGR
jgi:hypothetical protein